MKHGETEAFEAAFAEAQRIISPVPGYRWHQLQKCVENDHRYLLLVSWERLEDHTEGFRGSPEYQDWKRLLHHFLRPLPHRRALPSSGPDRGRERCHPEVTGH